MNEWLYECVAFSRMISMLFPLLNRSMKLAIMARSAFPIRMKSLSCSGLSSAVIITANWQILKIE